MTPVITKLRELRFRSPWLVWHCEDCGARHIMRSKPAFYRKHDWAYVPSPPVIDTNMKIQRCRLCGEEREVSGLIAMMDRSTDLLKYLGGTYTSRFDNARVDWVEDNVWNRENSDQPLTRN